VFHFRLKSVALELGSRTGKPATFTNSVKMKLNDIRVNVARSCKKAVTCFSFPV